MDFKVWKFHNGIQEGMWCMRAGAMGDSECGVGAMGDKSELDVGTPEQWKTTWCRRAKAHYKKLPLRKTPDPRGWFRFSKSRARQWRRCTCHVRTRISIEKSRQWALSHTCTLKKYIVYEISYGRGESGRTSAASRLVRGAQLNGATSGPENVASQRHGTGGAVHVLFLAVCVWRAPVLDLFSADGERSPRGLIVSKGFKGGRRREVTWGFGAGRGEKCQGCVFAFLAALCKAPLL